MNNRPPHIIKEEKCNVGTITLRSDNILMINPFDHIKTYKLKDLKQQHKIFMKITNGVPLLFISNVSSLKSFGAKERAFVNKTIHDFASACAIIENSALIRFIVHSSLSIKRSKIPIKMFKTEEAAINWLKSLNI